MKAFLTRFLRAPGVYNISTPNPGPGELQIKVAYASLNPTDYKHAQMSLPPSKVIGCDFSGVVTALGSQVPATSFSIGDRVAGVVHGCKDSHTGAFAETLVADANMCFKLPKTANKDSDMEAACTLGVGWISAAQALRQRLYKDEKPSGCNDDTLLIYSAATNTGMHAIQQARVDFPSIFIIALASSQHHEYLRKLGAHATFDYKSSSLVEDVQKLGKDIRKCLDCHSEGNSTVLAAQCMVLGKSIGADTSKRERRVIRTLPPGMMSGALPPGVRANEWILSYTALGKPFWFLFKYYPALPSHYETATSYLKSLTGLLETGRVEPVKHRLMPGGLENINQGFDEMRNGRVRGEKLVYKIGVA
ncbi:MAG: hypothetical protein Q9210_006887 [Variospora velana]